MAGPDLVLYNRGLVLSKIETTFGTDPTPTPTADAILVEDPVFSVDVQQLERNNLEDTLSPEAVTIGRKIASCTFKVECKHNANLLGTVPPQVGTLLRASAMLQTARTAGGVWPLTAPHLVGEPPLPTGRFTYVEDAAYSGLLPRIVTLTCTTGGGSGTAEFTVASNAVGVGGATQAAYSATGVLMTNAMEFVLGGMADGSPSITPTVVTSFASGDKFVILLLPPGYTYNPISDPANMESVTLYIYYDGVRHIMTGCRGTWSLEAPGGEFAKFTFNMTGNYADPTDAAVPTNGVFETTKPPQVELANFVMHGGADNTLQNNLVVSEFGLDLANKVIARPDINLLNAYAGAQIVDRRPVGTFNPELTVVATHNFWANLSAGARMFMGVRVGKVQGNVVFFVAPYAQYSNLQYQDGDGLRRLPTNLQFARTDGDDELFIHFS